MKRNHPWRRALLAASLATGAVCGPAAAQDYQRFRPAPGTEGYLTVEGALVPEHKTVSPSLWLNYGHDPVLIVDDDGNVRERIVESMTTLNLMAAIGLWDRLELGVDLPVHLTTGEGVEAENKDGAGLGDVRLLPKVRILGARDTTGLGLALALPVSLPTGSDKRGMSAAKVTLNPKAIVEGRLGPWVRLAANGGYKWVPSNETLDPADQGTVRIQGTEIGNELTYGAAVGVHPGTKRYEVFAELFGAAPAEEVNGNENAKPLELDLAVRHLARNGLATTIGAGTGFVAALGTPDLRVFAGLAWAPPPVQDQDGDGLADEADKCPAQAEDKDGFEDKDGCPDADNDADTFLDALDKCPNEPETRNGFADDDGCPDAEQDRDGDGLTDSVDKCPADPEDKDAFEDRDGCPDPDNDRDGVLDAADKCPAEAETKNDFQDEDGCPDTAPQVRVTASKLEILDKVFFDNDKATIKAESFGILDQVAATMNAHPEIKKIRIEGHTSNKGAADHNLDLSKRRAQSVRRYLIEKGVAADRLVAEGFGAQRPLDATDSPAADEKNRRVEFIIVAE
ncbi:OmpA family protein [Myxococcota bacterium]|nr:OmpA family protein [Myxococcota bacterium]